LSNLTSPSDVRAILRDLGVRPSKALGQNFLIDRNILNLLIDAAALAPDDQVLEVGAGLGVVTAELLREARSVTAVEKDNRLHAFLESTLGDNPSLRLIHADAMDVDAAALFAAGINVVVANLPYSVGSRLLADFVTCECPPERVVVTVQREVGDRLAATPGTRDYGLLSVWTQLCYEVVRVKKVSPTCFWPVPEVGSMIVRLNRRDGPLPGRDEMGRLRAVTRGAFAQRRKQLATILPRLFPDGGRAAPEYRGLLESLGLDARARPGELSADEWRELCRAFAVST